MTTTRVIWAFDPFVDDVGIQRSAAVCLREISQAGPTLIEPVFVFSTFAPETWTKFPPEVVGQVRQMAQARLDRALKGTGLKELLPITMIAKPEVSLTELVDEIVAHARKTKAAFIVASTHARKGPRRWLMGSFAETLSMQSKVPLVLVNPKWKRTADFRRILFPTDFSAASYSAYRRAVELARAFGGEITIFHKVQFASSPVLETAFVAGDLYRSAFRAQQEWARRNAERWAKLAESKGVRAKIDLDLGGSAGSVIAAILDEASSRPGIIAMAAQSGPVASALPGSIARGVMRASECPVWMIHAK